MPPSDTTLHEQDHEVVQRVTGVNIGSEDHVGLMAALAVICRRLEILEKLFNDHSHAFRHDHGNRGRTKGPSV